MRCCLIRQAFRVAHVGQGRDGEPAVMILPAGHAQARPAGGDLSLFESVLPMTISSMFIAYRGPDSTRRRHPRRSSDATSRPT